MYRPILERGRPGRIPIGIAIIAAAVLNAGPTVICCAAPDPFGDPATAHADLVIVGAKIWTGVPKSEASSVRPGFATALAVTGEVISVVGSDAAARTLVGPGTTVIEAKGRRVIPGITDSHTHLIAGGFQLARLMLRDVSGREEFVRAVEQAARAKKPGEWLLGGRWSVESWRDPTPPNKSWIDPSTRDIPVYLTRMDGHQALVNSAALQLAGIDSVGPKDPPGGEIERDPKTGEPTGILKESARDLVKDLIPEPDAAERYEAFRRAMEHANSLGITSVHDMSVPADLEAFRLAAADSAMTLRVTTYLMDVSDWTVFFDEISAGTLNTKMFHLPGFKGFMDGSLGSRTAYMREPYSDAAPDAPYPSGQLAAMADPPESFRERVATVDARGLQLAVHSIGDEANHLLLNAYEAAAAKNGARDARHRVEHAQHLLVSDIPRFAALGVVASMQPLHKADDGRYAEKALGRKRLAGSYAYRQLLDSGALVCFGSDWPVVSLNPFLGMMSAVNARTLDGKVWLASHSTTFEEALRAYTVSPPRAIHCEDRFGTIEPGKLADLVVLADDPFSLSPDQIGDVRVDLTIVGGKVVYTRPD